VQPLSPLSRFFLPLRWAFLAFGCLASAVLAQPGSLDLSFDAHLSEFAAVYAIVGQPDGQILIGGAFDSVAGVPRANVARLNPDGSLDPSFNPGTAVDSGFVSAIAVDQNGRILLGGSFSSSDFSAANNLTRLNTDGSVDYSFDASLYLDGPVNAVVVQDEDYIVIAGAFVYVNGYRRQNVARLHQDGTLDYAFDACVASTAGIGATALALLPDGHILVTGKFTFTGDRARDGIARLESCGDLDSSYAPQPGINTNGTVFALALLTNGNVLLGGDFVLYHGQYWSGLVELDTNGVPLSGFDPGFGVLGETAFALAVQADQKPIVGGSFSYYDLAPAPNIARLAPDGALDSTFKPDGGPDNAVSSILPLPNGQIIVAGKFASYDGVGRAGLVRLHGDLAAGVLSPPVRQTNGQWQFLLNGEEGRHYEIQASSDLLTWNSLTNLIVRAAPLPITDPTANQMRFYRAISGP
jgi:uncharacterized delta-60 repeat protein